MSSFSFISSIFNRKYRNSPLGTRSHVVNHKTYSTAEPKGLELWKAVSSQIAILHLDDSGPKESYGKSYLIRPRLGQGAFRSALEHSPHSFLQKEGEACRIKRSSAMP